MRNSAGEIDGEKAMGIEAIDITSCGIDDRRAIVGAYEAKLANAKKQRDTISLDIRKASAAADAGDQKARFELAFLNKQQAAVGRLVLQFERSLAEARKSVGMAEVQAAMIESRRASVDAAAVPGDKWFEVSCPDGRKVRHRGSSSESLQRTLHPGYRVVGQVFGHDEDGSGGFVSMSGAPSMLKALLESHGDELLAWLAGHGVGPTAA
jgi:hypothetical protein